MFEMISRNIYIKNDFDKELTKSKQLSHNLASYIESIETK